MYRAGAECQAFFLSSELELPQPLTRRRVPPPPLVPGEGAHLLAREGVGESQIRRGNIQCGTLYIYVLCAEEESAEGDVLYGVRQKGPWASLFVLHYLSMKPNCQLSECT